jgi:hypothetical protein
LSEVGKRSISSKTVGAGSCKAHVSRNQESALASASSLVEVGKGDILSKAGSTGSRDIVTGNNERIALASADGCIEVGQRGSAVSLSHVTTALASAGIERWKSNRAVCL